MSFHHFFSHLIHLFSFNFIRICDVAPGLIGRHPYYLQTFSKGASSHLIPRPGTVSDMSWGYRYGIKLGKRENLEIKTQNPCIAFHDWPLATSRLELGFLVDQGVISLLLTQRVRVSSPVGWISWLSFSRSISSTVRQMSGNLGHLRPRVSLTMIIIQKP